MIDLTALERALRALQEHTADLIAGHAGLEARIERMFRKGKVTDVDPVKGLYRQEIGLDDDGNAVKSPWLPYSQVAGGRKVHSPPSVGEQYLLVNPDGSPDFTQGLGVPHGWYDANPSPSTAADQTVATQGTTTDTTRSGSRVIAADPSSALAIQSGGWVVATIKSLTQFVFFDGSLYWTINPGALLPASKPPDPS